MKIFLVYTKNSIWYLKAKTTADRDDWIEKLKFARGCMRMKDEEELKRILDNRPTRPEKLHASETVTELNKSVGDLCKNLLALEVKVRDFRHSLSKDEELGKAQIADLKDTSRIVAVDIANAITVAKRYQAQSKCLRDEVKRLMHDLRFEAEQRSNLLRHVELQAKQLKCIEKSVRPKRNSAAEKELSKLDGFILAADVSESEKDVGVGSGSSSGSWHDDKVMSETGGYEFSESEKATSCSKDTAQADAAVSARKSEEAAIKQKSSQKQAITSAVAFASAETSEVPRKQITWKRRTNIPPRKTTGTSLWSFLKNALGKELSRIPLPVDFNEPLSFLQRLSECLEYANLLDKAAKVTDPAEQMVLVATFVISTLCNTPFRTCKPFNPLWCETFEFDRMYDLGWRAIAEQVSHHPPISAIHAEGKGWTFDEDMCVRSNFQATAMKIFPEGTISIFFSDTKSFYYWTMKDIKTCVKGFIIGPVTVHNEGDCIIKSQPDGTSCTFTLTRHSFFSSYNERSFSGKVCNKSGKELYRIFGDWSQKCVVTQGDDKQGRVVWSRKTPPKGSESMYNFTAMAIELNEPEDGVAPTDSRLRPDMRMMENGNWETANIEKGRLEEKQRVDTKKFQDMLESGQKVVQRPIWFKKCFDRSSNTPRYIYQGQYWKCKEQNDWSRCPDLFGKT